MGTIAFRQLAPSLPAYYDSESIRIEGNGVVHVIGAATGTGILVGS